MATFQFHPDHVSLMAALREYLEHGPHPRTLTNDLELAGLLDFFEAQFSDRDRFLEDYLNHGIVIPPSLYGFDCFVDPTLAADNSANRNFKTVASAVNFMYGLGAPYTSILKIGFIPNKDNTLASDTVAITTWPTFCFIEGVHWWIEPFVASSYQQAQWYINAQAHAAPVNLFLRGISIKQGNVQSFFPGTPSVIAEDCYFDGVLWPANGHTNGCTINAGGTSSTALYRCFLSDTEASGSTSVLLHECQIYVGSATSLSFGVSNATQQHNMAVLSDCNIRTGQPSATIHFPGTAVVYNPYVNFNGGTTGTVTLSFEGTQGAVMGAWHKRGNSEAFSITNSNGCAVNLDGVFANVTLAAPAASPGNLHRLNVEVVQALDITGPAHVSGSVDGFGTGTPVTIRGKAVGAHLSAQQIASSAGVVLTLDGTANGCMVSAAAVLSTTAGTNKACAILAGASKNIVDVAGATTFPTASTDAGTGDLVRFA